MKLIKWVCLFVVILFLGQNAAAQQFPNTFKVGEFLEVFPGDSLKVYYTGSGSVTKETCAEYYRTGKVNPSQIGFIGAITDYYIAGGKAFEGRQQHGLLQGKATFYHQNGSVSETGTYRDNVRSGVWRFFYPDGRLEKIFNYVNGEPLVVTYLDSSNVVQVTNGNGFFTQKFVYNESGLIFTIAGNLKDGRMHGEWAFAHGPARELFENGQFIKGYTTTGKNNPAHHSNYSDGPRMRLSGFYPAEYLNLDENAFCPFYKFEKGKPRKILIKETKPYRYKKTDYRASFYPELLQHLEKEPSQPVSDQWLIVGLTLQKSGKLGEIKVYSSIKDQALENKITAILKQMDYWDATRRNKNPIADHHYFSLQVQAGNIWISYLERKKLYR